MECKGACELESAHRAGDRAAMAAERAASAQIDSLKHQRDLLGQALGELLVALGAVEAWDLTGPELLMAAQEMTKALKGEESGCTGITATHCPIHGDCTCPKPTDTGFEPMEYLSADNCPLHASHSMHGSLKYVQDFFDVNKRV